MATHKHSSHPRTVRLTVHRTLEHEGESLGVEQTIDAQAWDDGLTDPQRKALSVVAHQEAERLFSNFQGFSDWPARQAEGAAEFRWLLEECLRMGGNKLALLAHTAPVPAVREKAAVVFRSVIDRVFRRAYPVQPAGRLVPVVPDDDGYGFIESRAEKWRAMAVRILTECGEPVDDWHQAIALSLLLCPALALQALVPPIWFPPPPIGQTDLEREGAAMVGAPDTAERAAVKAKRHLRKALGYERPSRRPGSKPGTRRPPSSERLEFEEYVRRRADERVSAAMIAEDSEAQRLYRVCRRNRDASLREQTVRRVLRSPRTT
jgi:hypothetical protein